MSFKKLYQKLVLRKPTSRLAILRKDILDHFATIPKENISSEEQEVINFLKKNKPAIFPYSFPKKYKQENIQVYKDEQLGLNYVIENGKRLYFKRSWSAEVIQEKYNFLLMEQDIDSPHRYLTDSFSVEENDVVADIGVA